MAARRSVAAHLSVAALALLLGAAEPADATTCPTPATGTLSCYAGMCASPPLLAHVHAHAHV